MRQDPAKFRVLTGKTAARTLPPAFSLAFPPPPR